MVIMGGEWIGCATFAAIGISAHLAQDDAHRKALQTAFKFVGQNLWRWTVVLTIFGFLLAAGVTAMYSGGHIAAVTCYFVAVLFLATRACLDPKTTAQEYSGWVRFFVVLLSAALLASLRGWAGRVGPSELEAKFDRILSLLNKNANSEPELSLPGFSMQALIAIQNPKTQTRKYIWDVGTEKGSRESVYVSADGLLTYAVVDRKGELYDVRAQLGGDGIPAGEAIFLACQLGITGTSTVMSLVVNGTTVATREFPSRIEIDLRKAPGGRIGGDINNRNSGTFTLYWLAFYNRTLTVREMWQNATTVKNQHPNLKYSIRQFNAGSGSVPTESVAVR